MSPIIDCIDGTRVLYSNTIKYCKLLCNTTCNLDNTYDSSFCFNFPYTTRVMDVIQLILCSYDELPDLSTDYMSERVISDIKTIYYNLFSGYKQNLNDIFGDFGIMSACLFLGSEYLCKIMAGYFVHVWLKYKNMNKNINILRKNISLRNLIYVSTLVHPNDEFCSEFKIQK
jgi:hypothetical protein